MGEDFFCNDSNETPIYVSKYRVEACTLVNCGWLFLRKEGHSMQYHGLKVCKIQNFDKRSQNNNRGFGYIFETNSSVAAKKNKKYLKIYIF